VDPAQVQAAVERALDRKLAPIRAMLARMEADRGIGVQDVVGGLGWILGLVGLAAWMRYRKQG
jgi:nickel transport protein